MFLSVRAFATNRNLNAQRLKAPMQAVGTSSVRTWLRSDPGAATVPWVGDSMVTLFRNGPDGAKITIAVVGDGFAAADQDAYNAAVDSLVVNGLFANDFFSANKSAFNLLRINLVSVDSGVGVRTYNADGTVTQVDRDTALGVYFNGDFNHNYFDDGLATGDRLALALKIWVPDHRIVVVLLNNPGFGGLSAGGRLTLPLGVGWTAVAHEFGHSLGGLGDEYHAGNVTYRGSEPRYPNLTISTNRANLKWASFVAPTTPIPTGGDTYTAGPKPDDWKDNLSVGLFEGGNARDAKGIYHPVLSCRMNSVNPPYCPVCNATMASVVVPHASLAAPGPGGGEIPVDDAASQGYARLVIHRDGDTLSILESRDVDGPLVQADVLVSGLVHEVLVGGRQVAMGSMPDAGVIRTFTEPGAGGRREHESPLDTYDFVVRVPHDELRGADPSSLTINLLSVGPSGTGHRRGRRPLLEDPETDTVLIASLSSPEMVDLPASLRSVIESAYPSPQHPDKMS